MAAVMAIAVQPSRVRGGPLGVAAVDGGVGALVGQGAVEALDLAVGLRPVGRVRLCLTSPRAAVKARER